MHPKEIQAEISASAANFCNGSFADDQARLRKVLASGDKDPDMIIDALVREAIDSLQAIVNNAPDEPSTLEPEDFYAYYSEMAEELRREMAEELE